MRNITLVLNSLALVTILFIDVCKCGILSFFAKEQQEKGSLQIESYLRGVPTKIYKIYSAEKFVCDTGSLTLNRSQINDNYCDCKDGQDEPGTSACLNGIFYCLNRGFRTVKIPTSRVDDGVCDCCDGTDEGIITTCPNSCAVAATNEREKLYKLQKAYDKGSKIRDNLINEVKENGIKKSGQIDSLKASSTILQENVEKLRTLRNTEEELEENERMVKKLEVVTKVSQRLGENLLTADLIAKLLAELFDVTHTTEDDVRAAMRSLKQPTADAGHDNIEDDDVPPPPHRDAGSEYDDDVPDTDADVYADEHSLPVEHAADSESEAEPISDCILTQYTTDPRVRLLCKAAHDDDSLRKFLVHIVRDRKATNELQLLWGFLTAHGTLDGASEFARGVLYPSQETEGEGQREGEEESSSASAANTCPALFSIYPGMCTLAEDVSQILQDADDEHKRLEAEEARAAFSTAESEYRKVMSEIRDIEKYLSDLERYQDKLAFLALKGKCVEGKDGKFTYKLCMMDYIQQSALEEDDVRLGKFDSFEEADGGTKLKMTFRDGQYCHAFGPRSAEVEVTCGGETVLRDATEPSTCFYSFKLETPAACSPTFAEFNGLY